MCVHIMRSMWNVLQIFTVPCSSNTERNPNPSDVPLQDIKILTKGIFTVQDLFLRTISAFISLKHNNYFVYIKIINVYAHLK